MLEELNSKGIEITVQPMPGNISNKFRCSKNVRCNKKEEKIYEYCNHSKFVMGIM